MVLVVAAPASHTFAASTLKLSPRPSCTFWALDARGRGKALQCSRHERGRSRWIWPARGGIMQAERYMFQELTPPDASGLVN